MLSDWKVMILEGAGRTTAPPEKAWPELSRRRYAALVDDWWRRSDAIRVGRAAGMQRPVSWPEMLLAPPIPEER